MLGRGPLGIGLEDVVKLVTWLRGTVREVLGHIRKLMGVLGHIRRLKLAYVWRVGPLGNALLCKRVGSYKTLWFRWNMQSDRICYPV